MHYDNQVNFYTRRMYNFKSLFIHRAYDIIFNLGFVIYAVISTVLCRSEVIVRLLHIPCSST